MGFWLKKFVSALLTPVAGPLCVVAVALAMAYRDPKDSRPIKMVAAAFALLYVASLPLTAYLLVAPLEADMGEYQPTTDDVAAISVLGAGYHPVEGRPLTGQMSGASIVRVVEAVRVASLHPAAMLHCSGAGFGEPGSNARAACQLAVQLGVAATRVVLHEQTRDTEEEAIAVVAAANGGRIVLVTHAAHMPRALALFERHGAVVETAPCGHISPAQPSFSPIPSSYSLGTTSGAWHEWLGRLWGVVKAGFSR